MSSLQLNTQSCFSIAVEIPALKHFDIRILENLRERTAMRGHSGSLPGRENVKSPSETLISQLQSFLSPHMKAWPWITVLACACYATASVSATLLNKGLVKSLNFPIFLLLCQVGVD